MVYEDALTILSYASPYPVKVTLQKERRMSRTRKASETYSNLSHPLYRSQSVDTIAKIGKDSLFLPQRSLSVASQGIMKDRLHTSPVAKFSLEKESVRESDEVKQEVGTPPPKVNLNTSEFTTTTQVEINTPPEEVQQSAMFPVADESFTAVKVETEETAPPISSLPPPLDLGGENDSEPPPEPLVPPPPLDFDTPSAEVKEKPQISEAASEFAALFDTLNEQDKLDMLRLSYEDPDGSFNTSQNTVTMETSLTEGETSNDTVIDLEPKSPVPMKPIRRKKKSSSGSVSSPELSPREPETTSPAPDDVIDDVMATVSVERVECAPSSNITDNDEINEELIMPEKKSREISILSQNIEFSVIDPKKDDNMSDLLESPRDGNKTLVDYSLSDMESTLRPRTPDNQQLIEEETITPIQNKRGALESSIKLFDNSDISVTPTSVSDPSGENFHSSGEDNSESDSKINTTVESVDFNLNMTSNPNLFSTPYPSRNEKETAAGISYDISMTELNDIENQMKKEPKESGKGGIAFEVRDDVVSGGTVLTGVSKVKLDDLGTTNVSRTMSYQENLRTAEKIKLERPLSFKADMSKSTGTIDDENSLEWSGKRLVRSGSFSEIPQDADKDWTDNQTEESLTGEEELNSSNESLEQADKKGLTKATLFRARENLANLSSDNSDSLQSITSSSRGSTPPPPYTANGNEDHGLGTSPETTPIKAPLNINELSTTSDLTINTDLGLNEVIPTVTSKMEDNGNYTVTMETTHADDTDC